MSYLKKINVFRRKLTQFITSSIGKKLSNNRNFKRIEDFSKINKILIIRPNHRLGNTLLFTPLVQEVMDIFPNASITLFVKGKVSKIIFQNYNQIESYIILPKKHFKKIFRYINSWFTLLTKKYDLVINVAANSSSGKLATKYSNATYKFYGNEFEDVIDFTNEQNHFAKLQIYKLRNYFYQSDEKINKKPIKELSLLLNNEELEEGRKTLNSIINFNDKQTIAIFTFATGNKCYSKEWWMEFYNKLIFNFNEYNIIEILPFENVSQIDFIAPTFYSKEIREIASLISNTKLFIGADSGMMHLACATKANVIGLFSETPKEKYGPYGNNKLGINTNEVSIDENIEIIKQILESKSI